MFVWLFGKLCRNGKAIGFWTRAQPKVSKTVYQVCVRSEILREFVISYTSGSITNQRAKITHKVHPKTVYEPIFKLHWDTKSAWWMPSGINQLHIHSGLQNKTMFPPRNPTSWIFCDNPCKCKVSPMSNGATTFDGFEKNTWKQNQM